MGSGSMSFYNGTALLHRSLELNEPVIVVTLNVSWGFLFFLASNVVVVVVLRLPSAFLTPFCKSLCCRLVSYWCFWLLGW